MTTVSDRLTTTHPLPQEARFDRSTRPCKLQEYVGQTEVREQMQVFLQAAKLRQEALDHVLIAGPPGLGKTTLAYIIAHEMGAQLKTTSGPVLEKPGDLAAMLTHLEAKDILFIDEIHRLNPAIEEILYHPLEYFQLDLLIGQGPSARSIKLDLPPFTLVGATTRTGLLTSPLRDRFGITQHLRFYTVQELALIVMRAAKILKIFIDESAAQVVAQCSRGTPRIANRLLRRVNDFAIVQGVACINNAIATKALHFFAIDAQGLDQQDRRLLCHLIEKFGGGPVGLESLATTLGESKDTIEEVIEPFLVQEGFILRTPRGRIATPLTYQRLKLPLPAEHHDL